MQLIFTSQIVSSPINNLNPIGLTKAVPLINTEALLRSAGDLNGGLLKTVVAQIGATPNTATGLLPVDVGLLPVGASGPVADVLKTATGVQN